MYRICDHISFCYVQIHVFWDFIFLSKILNWEQFQFLERERKWKKKSKKRHFKWVIKSKKKWRINKMRILNKRSPKFRPRIKSYRLDLIPNYRLGPKVVGGGQNGPISSIFEIFSNRTLFRKLLGIYHFFWYSSLVSSSIIFFNPPWHDDIKSWN